MSKLDAFIKGSTDPERMMPGCANYSSHYDCCSMSDEKCLVMEGKRCGYFEKAVLPTGDSIIQQKYEVLTGVMLARMVTQNLCNDCGCSIKPRHRYCDKCKRKRQHIASRALRAKKAG